MDKLVIYGHELATMQHHYEDARDRAASALMARVVAEVRAALREGRGERIPGAEDGKTAAQLCACGCDSVTGGSPLSRYRVILEEMKARAERERWGFPAEAAPEVSKALLQVYATEPR